MDEIRIAAVAAPENLEAAFMWLCRSRRDYGPNQDVWDLRRHWPRIRHELAELLTSGAYHFQPLALYLAEGEVRAVWSARDALVLRALANVLGTQLTIHPACSHVKGHGGVTGSLRKVSA